MLHWNGSSWSQVASPVTQTLTAVSIAGPGNAWAAGEDGIIIHWNGQSWSPVSSPVTETLTDIAMISPSDGWAGSYGVILHWDGATWSDAGSPSPLWGSPAFSVVSSTRAPADAESR